MTATDGAITRGKTLSDGLAKSQNFVPAQVAIVCGGTEIYGIGTIIRLYAAYMPEALFVCRQEGPLTDHLKKSGRRVEVGGGELQFVAGSSLGTIARLPGALRAAGRDAARLWPVLRSHGIRVFHAPTLPEYLIGGHLRDRGIANVWHVNNNTNRRRLFGLGLKLNHALARRYADVIIAASDFIAGNWQGCGKPVVTVRNAAAPHFPAPNVLKAPPYRCVIAGRLEESKGHHLAVEAVIAARQNGLDVRLDVFGGPLESSPYADALRSRVKQTGNQDAVRFLGFVTDLRQRHQHYHLALHCRIDPEPCSLWVCEAQADGLPLLASASGGTPELIEDRVSSCLCKPGDQQDLSQKLLELLQSPESLAAMRPAAFLHARTKLSPERMVRDTLSAYACIA